MENLNNLQNQALKALNDVVKYAEQENLTNTQTFLDFLDTVNSISVEY